MTKHKIHIVKKGETLEKISKSYNHKKWEDIWNDPANKKLKSSRKRPNNIESGDKIVIPNTAAEKAEIIVKLGLLHFAKLDEESTAIALEKQAKEFDKSAATFDRYMKETNYFYDKLKGKNNADLKTVKKWGKGVDISKQVIMMGRDLAKIAKLAKKSTTATGAKLTEINAEVQKIANKLALKGSGKLNDELQKVLSNYLMKKMPKEIQEAQKQAKVIQDSWDNMQKPSFWALTASSLLDGKGWSASVTRDLSEEKKQMNARLDVQRMKQLATDSRIKQQCLAASSARMNAAIAARKRVKLIEKEIQKMPSL